MERALRCTVFLAAFAQGAGQTPAPTGACPGVNLLNTCQTDLNANVAQLAATGGKEPTSAGMCTSLASYEACLIQNEAGCATISVYKTTLATARQTLSATYGIDCQAGMASTTPELMSGDSGSPSGSAPSTLSASSGSDGSALLPWQIVMLLLCLCCCCAGAAGGAYMMMGKKGKAKGTQKPAPRPREDYPQEAMPLQPEPVAKQAFDTSGDGIADVIVTGEDKNRDGIPDVLEGDKNAPAVVEQIPPMVPTVQTYSEPVVAEAPALFGQLQPLLPGPTVSSVVMAPTTTSSYMTTPMMGTTYPTTTSAYTPAYAPTTYAGGYTGATTYASPAFSSVV